jgi:hypothetical protein
MQHSRYSPDLPFEWKFFQELSISEPKSDLKCNIAIVGTIISDWL